MNSTCLLKRNLATIAILSPLPIFPQSMREAWNDFILFILIDQTESAKHLEDCKQLFEMCLLSKVVMIPHTLPLFLFKCSVCVSVLDILTFIILKNYINYFSIELSYMWAMNLKENTKVLKICQICAYLTRPVVCRHYRIKTLYVSGRRLLVTLCNIRFSISRLTNVHIYMHTASFSFSIVIDDYVLHTVLHVIWFFNLMLLFADSTHSFSVLYRRDE